MDLLIRIKEKARIYNQRIVLPEGDEERTLKAADLILQEKLARIILIGDKQKILSEASQLGLLNIPKAEIINPSCHEKKEEYINLMLELRKSKGLTREMAVKLIEDPL